MPWHDRTNQDCNIQRQIIVLLATTVGVHRFYIQRKLQNVDPGFLKGDPGSRPMRKKVPSGVKANSR